MNTLPPTNERARRLLECIQSNERALAVDRRELARLQTDCNHTWTGTLYNPIVTPAYTHPGDQPGTMGVDWRGPVNVPRSEHPRWTRTCTLCGLVQHTERTSSLIAQIPAFP